MSTYQTTKGEVTDLAGHLLVCDAGKPCFLCGSPEGGLFSSTDEGHPFHKPCIEQLRSKIVGNLEALMDFAEEDLKEDLKPWHVRAWNRIKLWLFPAAIALFVTAATNQTYTVKTPVWETTNAIEITRNHEPGCTLVRYVEKGVTNEFHAWAVPVVVITNKPTK